MSDPTADPPADLRSGPARLGPADIATARFDRIRRHGLDPDQVYTYLRRVTHEVAALIREVAMAAEENQRLKTALIAWQAQLSPTQTPDGYLGRTNPAMAPRPMRDNEYPTDEWPTQVPYPNPGPQQP